MIDELEAREIFSMSTGIALVVIDSIFVAQLLFGFIPTDSDSFWPRDSPKSWGVVVSIALGGSFLIYGRIRYVIRVFLPFIQELMVIASVHETSLRQVLSLSNGFPDLLGRREHS